MTKVSMPRKPSGLTNLPGKVNFIPMNIVRSTPAYTHRTNLTKLFSYFKVAPISNYSICIRVPRRGQYQYVSVRINFKVKFWKDI